MVLYLICGKARSGKDSLASFMINTLEKKGKKACRLKITDPLNHLLQTYFAWDGKDKTKPRDLMQEIGYNKISEELGKKNFFLDILTTKIEVLNAYFDVGIITDGRFIREIEYLKIYFPNLKTIYIERDQVDNGLTEKQKNHITEKDLDDYHQFDYNVKNNEDMNHLKKIAEGIVKGEEE